jgi:hypothetical protein
MVKSIWFEPAKKYTTITQARFGHWNIAITARINQVQFYMTGL